MQENQAVREIVEIPDMGIVLSDGCRLSARVWMPKDADDAPVPVILEYLPYRKRDGTAARDALTHPYFAERGYVCVRVDMRGNGDSDGIMHDEYTETELSDGVEVVNWLAAQPWCNGSVGMMGISWGGFNGLQIAALAPEPLKAVITLCSTVDRYADDIHYKGGCLLNENFGWGSTMWAYSSRPPDPALVGDKWRDMWLERLEAETFLPVEWLGHQTRDAYWKHGSVCEDYSAIKAQVLAIGGWGDAYKNTVPAVVANIDGAKGIIGPWVHKYPHFAVPEPRIGFLQEALRWWDRWLKGIETGVENDPDMRAYVMDGVRPKAWYEVRDGRWIVEDDWAGSGDKAGDVDRTTNRTKVMRFTGDGGLVGGVGNPEADNEFSALVASPAHCGMAAGEYCAIWLGPEMPGDQRVDDAYSTVFMSAPLTAADGVREIVGAPKVHLRVSSDRVQGQIAVRLNHIHPDGASTRITYGVLNLSHRDGPNGRGGVENPRAMVPGEVEDIAVTLDHIAYLVPEGHRISISISSAYWPLLWPSADPVCLTISAGAVAIPTRGNIAPNGMGGADEWQFETPEAAPAQETEVLRAGGNTRRIETDMASGVVTLVIEDDFGKRRDSHHGGVSGSIAREWWSIHPDDPLSARGRTHWTEEVERSDIKTRTETWAEMHADKTHFHLSARLEAWEGERLIFAKDLSESVERNGI